ASRNRPARPPASIARRSGSRSHRPEVLHEEETMSAPHSRHVRQHPQVPGRARLRFSPRAPLTDRLFLRLCIANPDLRLERTALGDLIIMPPTGSGSGERNLNVSGQLYNWTRTNGLGIAFDSSTGFTLPNGAIRSPDASWVERDRWDALTPEEQE